MESFNQNRIHKTYDNESVIVGKTSGFMTEKVKKDIGNIRANQSLNGLREIRNERLITITQLAQNLLKREIKILFGDERLNYDFDLTKRVHFVNGKDYRQIHKDRSPGSEAVTFILKKQAIFDYDFLQNFDDIHLLRTFIHEAIHLYAHSKILISQKNKSVSDYRVGYKIKSSNEHIKFYGLDEAIVEWLAWEVMYKNEKEINSVLNTHEKEWQNGYQAYREYIEVLNSIIKKISEINGMSEYEVWNDIKKSEFTGNLMFLRVIDEVFGKKSLRILSLLGKPFEKYNEAQVRELESEYFTTEDNSIREQIKSKLFSGSEQEKHQAA